MSTSVNIKALSYNLTMTKRTKFDIANFLFAMNQPTAYDVPV